MTSAEKERRQIMNAFYETEMNETKADLSSGLDSTRHREYDEEDALAIKSQDKTNTTNRRDQKKAP